MYITCSIEEGLLFEITFCRAGESMSPFEVIEEEIELSNEDSEEEEEETARASKRRKYNIPISKEIVQNIDDLVSTTVNHKPHEANINPLLEPETIEEKEILKRAKVNAKLDYLALDSFQNHAILSLIRGINTVLVVPTGSGKTAVMQVALEALREIKEIPDGIGVCLQPLNSILREKSSDSSHVKSVFITMSGEAESEGVSISNTVEELEKGGFGIIYAHAESLLSDTGSRYIKKIKKKILFIILDEAHMSLKEFWGKEEMRVEMKNAPSSLRIQGRFNKAPMLIMTATATPSNIKELKQLSGIDNSPCTIISMSPVLSNHIYMKVERPPSNRFYSVISDTGETVKHGLKDLLLLLYLQQFIDAIKSGRKPKHAMIFTTLELECEINDFLIESLKDCDIIKDPDTVPWIVTNSVAGDVTIEKIRKRMKTVFCWVTSTVSLMGINFCDMDYVITPSPFRQHHSLLQAVGRSGRRLPDGGRKVSVLYALYNAASTRVGLPGLDPSVRTFYSFTGCLKMFMHQIFCEDPFEPSGIVCCSNCIN